MDDRLSQRAARMFVEMFLQVDLGALTSAGFLHSS
jgi:hypothetical protein